MGLDWSQIQLALAVFGSALGTSLGAQFVNARQRKTIDKAVEAKVEIKNAPLTTQNTEQEARIQALEAAVFRWRPREGAPPIPPDEGP